MGGRRVSLWGGFMTFSRSIFILAVLAVLLSLGARIPDSARAEPHSAGVTSTSDPETAGLENVRVSSELGESVKKRDSHPRLENVEERMHALQGQIQDLKSRILTLGEDISQGFVTGTKLLIVHDNQLGGAFEIESIEYKLDGFTVYTNNDPKRIGANPQFVVFDASVLPGNHTIDAIYTLRATGYGVFTYMEQYSFDMRSQYHFSTPRGKAVELSVEAVDQGGSKNLRERPVLRFAVQ